MSTIVASYLSSAPVVDKRSVYELEAQNLYYFTTHLQYTIDTRSVYQFKAQNLYETSAQNRFACDAFLAASPATSGGKANPMQTPHSAEESARLPQFQGATGGAGEQNEALETAEFINFGDIVVLYNDEVSL